MQKAVTLNMSRFMHLVHCTLLTAVLTVLISLSLLLMVNYSTDLYNFGKNG